MANPIVAVLGTGTMGGGMVRSLRREVIDVRMWSRDGAKAEALRDTGAEAFGSPAEAARGADVVLTMVFDADAAIDVVRQAQPAEGTVWLQCTTVGVAGADRTVEVARELGLVLVDAPVLGTKQPAEEGTLVVLASGPEDVRERIAPVLDAIGSRTIWVGDAGAGSRLKLAANAWVFTVVEGVAESLALTRELGLDPRLFLDTISGGALDAPYVQLKGSAMLEDRLDPAFGLAGALKDAGLILDAAELAGLDLALLPGIRDHFARAVEQGLGDLDMAATYRAH
jgi:3-hydroxyisobutyrate dehydrogenase